MHNSKAIIIVSAGAMIAACSACQEAAQSSGAKAPSAVGTVERSTAPQVVAAPDNRQARKQGAGKLARTGAVTIEGRKYGPTFVVELAIDEDERSRGLMFRRKMADDHGMLFFMPGDSDWAFYMRNTYLPLDMVFIDSNWRVVGVIGNVAPLTETLRRTGIACRYVLELNAHMAKKHGIVAGTILRFERNEAQ